jgi:hypothetical protein
MVKGRIDMLRAACWGCVLRAVLYCTAHSGLILEKQTPLLVSKSIEEADW